MKLLVVYNSYLFSNINLITHALFHKIIGIVREKQLFLIGFLNYNHILEFNTIL